MRLSKSSKSSLFRAVFVILISFSLILNLSFSLRMASVSANPVTSQTSKNSPPRNC